MYALLLLDEGAPITETIKLMWLLLLLAIYGTAWWLILAARQTGKIRAIGLALACLLAVIGWRTWPKEYSWEKHTVADLSAGDWVLPTLARSWDALRFLSQRSQRAIGN